MTVASIHVQLKHHHHVRLIDAGMTADASAHSFMVMESLREPLPYAGAAGKNGDGATTAKAGTAGAVVQFQ